MPRWLLQRRYWQRILERQHRLAPGVVSMYQGIRKFPLFIDYWPDIPGTVPEKMLLAELIRRQFNVYFGWYIGDLPSTPNVREHYRPDIYLPDYNVIIEVQGVYWHTRTGYYEYDLSKAMAYTASGYKFYGISDLEIYYDLDAALDRIPEIRTGTIHGADVRVEARPFNPVASITARLQKYPRVYAAHYRGQRAASAAAISRYKQAGRRPRRAKTYEDYLFLGLTEEQYEAAMELRKFAIEWGWITAVEGY